MQGLDEGLGLAAGLRAEGTRLAQLDAAVTGDSEEGPGGVALGVIAEDALHSDVARG